MRLIDEDEHAGRNSGERCVESVWISWREREREEEIESVSPGSLSQLLYSEAAKRENADEA